MAVDAEAKLALVAERLNQMHGKWTLDHGPVLRGPGVITVTVGEDHTGSPNHLDLDIVLNSGEPDVITISDCSTGIAGSPDHAIRQAVAMWSETTAATVLELLTQRGQFGDHYRGADHGGFPGWHMITGGVTGLGHRDNPTLLQQWIVDNMPWTTLAPLLSEGLDRAQLNGVKFFLAAVDEFETAEVRINGRVHEPSSQALLALDWPRPTEFASARTFILLVHPEQSAAD
jgi:hypothetical protein